VGYPEQFAQRTFAEETERLTGGAASWQNPSEIKLDKVGQALDEFCRWVALRRPPE
jgi:hypothetical protein